MLPESFDYLMFDRFEDIAKITSKKLDTKTKGRTIFRLVR